MDDFRQKRMDTLTKNKLTAAIAKWVATACRPVNVVEDEGLANIVRTAANDWNYELPSRATITSHILKLHETEKAKLQQALEKTKVVALTGDYWTSISNHNYLGFTAHYFDPQWKLQSHALTVVKTEERHFADAVAEHFMQVAREWDIEQKVVSLTTDSARNMIAAARQLPFEHMPCIAHSVHRAVTVSLTNSPFDSALAKCRKVVGYFKHSPANQAQLEQQQVAHHQKKESLVQEVSTRWNSTLEMIKRVQRNAEPLRDALALHATNVAMPTATELEKLKKLEAVLEHCRYVSELLGGEKFVSCSVVLPTLCHLSRVMEVTEDDPAYMINFKGTFAAEMDGRKEKTNITWLRVATALDPRFKDLKCLSKPDRAEVWRMIRALLQEMESERPAQPDIQITPEPPKKKPTLMLAHESSSDEEEDSIEQCLERYKAEPLIGMDDCPQEWWSTHEGAHSEMARLARKYLATPATSAEELRLETVERARKAEEENKKANTNILNQQQRGKLPAHRTKGQTKGQAKDQMKGQKKDQKKQKDPKREKKVNPPLL
ncbi:E3 SUMO-protein ligase ZBED1-like [Cyprinodon tularosa]|uniref:E3 SUMO-protein ligase ZBED1-like n=1 Tax=Cyprinodon tularosa TaxID=77115 RepID=UPI0018E1ECB2|nr:E3 SUMO-protein ligase ZBED1-like [Cyprinodon tularosa]